MVMSGGLWRLGTIVVVGWGRALGTKGVGGDIFSVMHSSSRLLEYCMRIILKL